MNTGLTRKKRGLKGLVLFSIRRVQIQCVQRETRKAGIGINMVPRGLIRVRRRVSPA